MYIIVCIHDTNITAHNNIIIAEVAEKVLDKCSYPDEFESRMNENFWVEFSFEFIEDLQDLGSVHNTMLHRSLHCVELASLENIQFLGNCMHNTTQRNMRIESES